MNRHPQYRAQYRAQYGIFAVDTRIVIGPNASLTARQAVLATAIAAMAAFSIAMVFALLGFWPILPFAGLEVGALAAALAVCLRRNRYREVIGFDGECVRIDFGLVGEGARVSLQLQRAWTRVAVEPGASRNAPTRLALSCSGRRVEIGRCLTNEEREQLAVRLRGLVGSGWRQAPPRSASCSAAG